MTTSSHVSVVKIGFSVDLFSAASVFVVLPPGNCFVNRLLANVKMSQSAGASGVSPLGR